MLVQSNTYICVCKEGDTAESWLNQKANGDMREQYYSFLLTSAWKGIVTFHIHTVDVYKLVKNIFQMLHEQSKRDQIL